MVTLHDGTTVASDSWQWRLECLASHVLSIRPLQARREWLTGFERHNPAGVDELKRRIQAIHASRKKPGEACE